MVDVVGVPLEQRAEGRPVVLGELKEWVLGEVRRDLVRDGAANAALTGLLAGEKVEGTWASIARDAYSAADAMLAERDPGSLRAVSVEVAEKAAEAAFKMGERLAAGLERERVLRSSLEEFRSLVAVMFGTGPDATIAETVRSPLGVDIKLGEIWRRSNEVLGSTAGEKADG